MDGAFRYCEQITRSSARNFFYGIRLLPQGKRGALSAVYAFARRVDDVADGTLADDRKIARLAQLRAAVDGAAPGDPDPVVAAVGLARRQFSLPLGSFGDLLDGAEMDVRGTTYRAFDDLEGYCRRVAGSIGRLSVAVFGSPEPETAGAFADDLGVAMQLTNILRDVREDAGRGRLYLPEEDLLRFGCHPDPAGASRRAVVDLVRFEAARARDWFTRGLRLLPMLDARSAACVSAMTGIYRRILARLERQPEAILRRRVSLPSWEKAWVAARSLAGVSA
jgi:15-cis-phytoene synthase